MLTITPPRAPRGHHASGRLLSANEGPLEVGVEYGVPHVVLQFKEGCAREDRRIVDEDIEWTEGALDLGHEVPRLLGPGDVGGERGGPPAERGDLSRHGLGGGLVVQEVEGHIGTGGGEPERDRAADAALGARHEHDLSGTGLRRAHSGNVYHIVAVAAHTNGSMTRTVP